MENEKKYEQAEEAFTEGDYAVALKVYQDIFEHDQEQPNAVWGIAECFHSLGQIGEAIAWYKRYLSYEPNEPELWCYAVHGCTAVATVGRSGGRRSCGGDVSQGTASVRCSWPCVRGRQIRCHARRWCVVRSGPGDG